MGQSNTQFPGGQVDGAVQAARETFDEYSGQPAGGRCPIRPPASFSLSHSQARQAVSPRPLMPIQAVMWRLDVDEAGAMALVEDGRLFWAFNIASEADGARPCVRVLTQSVADYLAGRAANAGGEDGGEWRRVAALIFPAKPVIATCELARSLNCSRQQTADLIAEGAIRLVPGSRPRRGPGGQAQIVTASASEWLRQRRLT